MSKQENKQVTTEAQYDAEIEASDAKSLAKIRANFLNAKGLSDAKDSFAWIKTDPKACKKAISKEGLRCRVKGTNEVWIVRFKADIKWASVTLEGELEG